MLLGQGMTTQLDIAPTGTLVLLPDNTFAIAYPDPNAPGTYMTVQENKVWDLDRADLGWRREQLQIVGC